MVWREARELIWARRKRLAAGFGLMLVSRMASLVLPATSKYLIDDVIGKQQHHLLPWLAAAAGGATLLQAISSFSLSQVLGITAQQSITEMRRQVQRHVARLPVSYFDATKSGVLVSRIMTDAEGIRNLVGTGLVQLAGGFVTAAAAFVVLLTLNWQLTLATVTALALYGGGLFLALRKIRPLFRERGNINAEVTGRLAESLGGIRVVKAYAAERREELVFARGVHSLLRNVAKTVTSVSALGSVTTIFVGMISVLIMIVGGKAIFAGTMTLGDFVMYVFFTGLLAGPLMTIASIGTQMMEAFAGLDRIREVLGETTEEEFDRGKRPVKGIRGEVTFENVGFEYRAGVPVLEEISFRAAKGTTTALVGPSGSGKSTLLGLVMAFHQPKEGIIRIDGQPLRELRLREYRSHLGIVLQENFLFDGTIAENIRYGHAGATMDEIRRVAAIAHVDEFVDPLAETYQTIVGERGIKLSGGQRQRIAIARAILADPAILILDEATSSLDSESEALIQDGLRSLRRGRTTFVIAHRLSTIRSADQILVLEKGRIVERGTHAELLGLHGRYRQLYDRQYDFEHDRYINPGEELKETSEIDGVMS